MNKIFTLKITALLIFLFSFLGHQSLFAQCDVVNHTFTSPDEVFNYSAKRNGHCCGATGSTKCISFDIVLDPNAQEISFAVTPAPPGGAFYEINCDGVQIGNGDGYCIPGGTTNLTITYCKSGSELADYVITTSQTNIASDDITVQAGCSGQMAVGGVVEDANLIWTALAPNTGLESWLTPASVAEDTVYVNVPTGTTSPTFVEYEVTGTSLSCQGGTYTDTIRVDIVPGMTLDITPLNPRVCSGTTADVTANVTGGAPPYDFSWNSTPVQTTQTAALEPGTYTVTVSDQSTGCLPLTASVTVLPETPITADAGSNVTVCANNSDVVLNGSISGSTTAEWTTSGDGGFDDVTDLAATYSPGATDVTNGSVTLTLTTTDNGGCTAAVSSIVVTIDAAPIVDAGLPQTVCENNADVTLSGTVDVIGTTILWTTSGDGSFTPTNDVNSVYTPGTNDLTNGTVTLTLSSTLTGCVAVTDDVVITISPAPVVDAGTPQTVCANNADVTLSGTVSSGTPTWSTSGDGGFDNANSLTAVYTPGATDLTNGTVTLTLTSSLAGCADVDDTVVITISPAPVVDAGLPQTVCKNNPDVTLAGSSDSGTTIWATSGDGTFSNAGSLTSTYTAGANDLTAGTVTLTLTSSLVGCNDVSDDVVITYSDEPIVDAGLPQTVCENNADVTLSGTVDVIGTTILWTTSGDGSFAPTNNVNSVYTPGATDLTNGTVTLTLSSTLTGCVAVTDDVVITISPAPVVDAGTPQTVCANNADVTLSGTVSSGTPTWSTSGDGGFDNANSLTAVYTPGATDLTNGTVTLTLTSSLAGCADVDDTVVITISPAPVVDAGLPQTVCKNNPDVTLAGSSDSGTTTWTTSGDGTFSNAGSLTSTYSAGTNDLTSGTVTLTLTSSLAGCNDVSDDVVITYSDEPIVDAGLPQTVCENNADVTLSGTVDVIGTTILWTTSGDGSFAPTNNVNSVYTPGATDLTNGTVTLTLSSTLTGCVAVTDDVVITISPAPVVDAGIPQTVCANNAAATLSGTVSSGTPTWSTSGDGGFDNANSLTAVYTPGATDLTNGTVTLTLTSSLAGCADVDDTVVITISPAPVVDAGLPQTVCKNNPDVTLAGSSDSGTTTWTTSGDGTFSNAGSLTSTYTAGANDLTAGTVTLTLTSSLVGCNDVSDDVVITYSDEPIVDAGLPQTVCENNADVTLSGTVDVIGTTILWTTSGDGSFAPTNNVNSVYTPGATDLTNGTVTLTLSSTLTGCVAVTDDVVITISPAPVVDAGIPQTVCANNAAATLSGTVSSGTPTWSTSGDGGFDNANSLTAVYTPGATDLTNGTVTLTLTSSLAGCADVDDTVVITISPAPVVDAGLPQTVCKNNPDVTLAGSSDSGTTTWTTSGDGTFSNAGSLTSTYSAGTNDLTSGTVTLTLTSSLAGCNDVSDDVVITYSDEPIVDAGLPQTVCENNADVTLSGTVDVIGTTILWTTSGDGSFAPTNNVNSVYTPGATDLTNGTVTLTLSSTLTGCVAVTDDVVITISPAPVVDAGIPQTVCANNAAATLSGTVSSGTPTWSTSGDGGFDNANSLTAVYTPGATDLTNGTVTLTLTSSLAGCADVDDTVVITISPAPVVDAGLPQTVCKNNPDVTLAGSSDSGTTTWTTSGDGTFSNAGSLTSTYSAGTNDLTSGTVTLTLTSSLAGCNDVSDDVVITYSDEPIVDAGLPQTVCANNADVTLAGTVDVLGTTILWTTSGDGSFAPTNNVNSVYTPGATDLTNGTVTLTLSSTLTGCVAVTDDVVITISPAPVVDAGIPQTVCANNAAATLSGTVSSGTPTWSTSGDGGFDNANSLTAVYTPGATDLTNRTVTLTLTSSLAGCSDVDDTVVITISPTPIVFAGLDTALCKNDAVFILESTLSDLTAAVTWSTSGDGGFDNVNLLNAEYTPGVNDLATGSVTLTITITQTGCTDVADDIIITYFDPPTVDAGLPETVCANNSELLLNGSVSGSTTTGIWTTSGDGLFSDDVSMTSTYQPGASDIANGTVTLTLSATGSCTASDDVVITISPAPVVDAGDDQIVCESEIDVLLSATIIGGASQGEWSTLGDGTFSSLTDLNATYTFGTNDVTNAFMELVLTTTDHGNCLVVKDTVAITITPIPTVNAGADFDACANNLAALSGVINGAPGTGVWTSSGLGTFDDDTNLNTNYNFDANDITNGTVTLTLTSTGACQDVSADVIVTITPAPVVDAGTGIIVCETETLVGLNGSVTLGATTGDWSTLGDGTFDDISSFIANYTPGSGDVANGSVELILTSTNNGDCNPVQDTVLLTLLAQSTIDAGDDQTVCETATVIVDATLTGGATAVSWTSAGDGSFTSITTTGAVYIPGTNDVANGTVVLTATTTDANPCSEVSDFMTITFDGFALVDAGIDVFMCANNTSDVLLSGSVTSTSNTGEWTTNGDGTFSDIADMNATYTLGTFDLTSSEIELYLNPTNAGACSNLQDTLVIYLTPEPVVEAGNNISLCITDPVYEADLNNWGSVSGGTTTGDWSSGGDGVFSGIVGLDALYTLGTQDVLDASVWLYLTSTNNGMCNEVIDSLRVTIDAAPSVTADFDFEACAGDTVQLSGIISGGGSVTWISSGIGKFIPNNKTLLAEYVPDATEYGTSISFTLEYTNGCGGIVSDDLIVSIALPVVSSFMWENNCDDPMSVQFENLSSIISASEWDFGDGETSTSFSPEHTFPAEGFYDVELIITGDYGCADTLVQTVQVADLPVANYVLDTTVVLTDSIVYLIDESQNDVAWAWHIDVLDTISVEDTLTIFNSVGIYEVKLVVANVLGCTDTLSQYITVVDEYIYGEGETDVFPPTLPTAFTPNDDDNNDVLFVRGGPFVQFELRVFNHWGNQVFISKDPDVGWDGSYKDKQQPSGMYIWTFVGETADGEFYNLHGEINLIR